MRRFSSYGPINDQLHFHVPRTGLVEDVLSSLLGEDATKEGGYITVWAPRQRGKSWIMLQTLERIRHDHPDFDAAYVTVEGLASEQEVVDAIAAAIAPTGAQPGVEARHDLKSIFAAAPNGHRALLHKPLILVLDEFDSLPDDVIAAVVRSFRNIHATRLSQTQKTTAQMSYLLHGVALVGVRSVLGVDNPTGSPFNIQRSLHIPNLTCDEVCAMFEWFERESGRSVAPAVVERLHHETQGQPGLVSWLGELLATEAEQRRASTLTSADFDAVYAAAVNTLPNVHILNIIAKAKRPPYRELVLNLFQTEEKVPFRFDEPRVNFLYLNGVIEPDGNEDQRVHEHAQQVRFACPFVQKRLFNYFSFTDFAYTGRLFSPFEDLSDTITDHTLDVYALVGRYERHLRDNHSWLLKDAPRRRDLRVYEAVYHFTLYSFLSRFLQHRGGQVFPEFPTGNGRIDLVIQHAGKRYGLEVKSFTDDSAYREALAQAADYGRQLGLTQVALVLFVETIDAALRSKYEAPHTDSETGVEVRPMFVATAV